MTLELILLLEASCLKHLKKWFLSSIISNMCNSVWRRSIIFFSLFQFFFSCWYPGVSTALISFNDFNALLEMLVPLVTAVFIHGRLIKINIQHYQCGAIIYSSFDRKFDVNYLLIFFHKLWIVEHNKIFVTYFTVNYKIRR